MKTKKIILLVVAIIASYSMYAQAQSYNVSVCGNISNSNAGETVEIFASANPSYATTTVDSSGAWCFQYTVNAGASFEYAVYQQACLAGDTLPSTIIVSDTSFTSNWISCATITPSCSVSIFDSLGTDLFAVIGAGSQAPYSYSWTQGGAVIDTFSVLGNVTAGVTYCLDVTDANGCIASACYTVPGGGGSCSVIITATPDTLSGLMGAYTLTTNVTGVAPFTYAWDLSDGTLAAGATVNHGYNPSPTGTYTPCVTITDASGCSSVNCQTITLTAATPSTCDVVLTYLVDSVISTMVQFSSAPTGVAPYTYAWDFSDGASSTLANPIHVFVSGSVWDWACVEVVDANGCVSSYCDYIQLVNPTVLANCQAEFYSTFDEINGTVGEVFFHDVSTTPNYVTSWDWSFGNGQTSTAQNPSVTYLLEGYYSVCLTTTDSAGCTNTYCETIYVNPFWWTSNPWYTGGSCNANFFASQDTGIAGGLIYLVDLSLGNNLYYTWDFGNGTVVNSQYPVVTYSNFGTYLVCLTITDTLSGCTDYYCDTLTIDSLGSLNKLSNWAISVIPTPLPQAAVAASVLEEAETSTSFSLYPNPASDKVNVEVILSETEKVNIQLLDITGKVIANQQIRMSAGNSSHAITTSNLSNGVYFINVKSTTINGTERIIVQH